MNSNIIPCVLLPLEDRNLILPSTAISEIIPFEKTTPISDAPTWLLGILTWRGIHIPLTHIDQIESHLAWRGIQKNIPLEKIKKWRIAVINRIQSNTQNALKENNQYPFFSIVLKGMPKLYRITQNTLKGANKSFGENNRFLMEITLKEEKAFIPNLLYVWKIIDALPTRFQWFRQLSL